MNDMVTSLDQEVPGFEYKSATIGDTSRPKDGTRSIDKTEEIQLYDIEHFNGRLIHKMMGVFLVLCIISVAIAIVLYFVLKDVGINYLNIILADVFGVIAVVFLLLFAIKRKTYFLMEVYYAKYRDDIMVIDYNESNVNMGNRFPAKVEVFAKVKGKELASRQSRFVSNLGSSMASVGSAPVNPAIGYNGYDGFDSLYGMSFGMPNGGYTEYTGSRYYMIKIDPETKTVTLANF